MRFRRREDGRADRRTAPRKCHLRAAALLLAGAPLLASCRDAARAFGTSAVAARGHADDFLGAMTDRYTDVQRTARYEAARQRLAAAALIPSRVFDDTTVWTAIPGPATRVMLVSGDFADGRYRLQQLAAVGRPLHPGDTRHDVTLTKLDPKTYTWDTTVEFGVGELTPNDVGNLLAALFGTADGRGDRELRGEYRAAFPRTAAVLGRLFSVDTLRPLPLADGSTLLTVSLGMHPEDLRDRYPVFAQYLAKYLMPATYRFTVTDAVGATWFDVAARNGETTVRFRSLRGRLLPFAGAARPMPDSLHLRADVALKIRMFTVAVRDLDMDFFVTHTEQDRAFTMIARREPQWDLPLAAEHVIHASLKRPFEGSGAIFRIDLREDGHGQALLTRFTHLTVEESRIVKFLGAIGAHAANDLSGRSEREETAFLHDVFAALHDDVRTLLAGG